METSKTAEQEAKRPKGPYDSIMDDAERAFAEANTTYDFTDLNRGHIRQTVKISERISTMFQTMNGEENEFLQGTMDEMVGKPVNLIQARFMYNQLSLCLVSLYIDGVLQDLPNIRYDEHANIERASVASKRKVILGSSNNTMLDDIYKHYEWFERRAYIAYKAALKNG